MQPITLLQQPFLKTQRNPATKAIDLSPLGDYWYAPRQDEDAPDPAMLFRAVPWLARSVQLRSNAVASMPFDIMRGETVFDSSVEYQNKLGWLPNPRRLLYLTEAARSCSGSAYYWREHNRITTTGLRYIRWDTVEPEIDGKLGLTGFVRTVNGRRMNVPVETIVYHWMADPYVEFGPPTISPVMAALAASGVLYNLDRFASAYFARGAIKATLLTVSGAPVATERDRLKTWWKDLVSGIKNAFATEIINADSVTPVVIGEGLAELSNATLTAEKRQDIATALGVPQSVIFSESAKGLGGGGVAAQDDAHFYNKTIIPECEAIADVWNEQLLEPLGLKLVFRPETLDVFQEDENQRATAFSAYVAAGLPLEVAGEMLGLELPQGWTWEKIAAEKEKAREEMAAAMQGAGDQGQDDAEDTAMRAVDDLRKWRIKSAKRGKLAPFTSDWIPVAVMDEIKAHGTNGWRDALDNVIVAYTGETPEPVPVPVADTTELVAALKAATEALLAPRDDAKKAVDAMIAGRNHELRTLIDTLPISEGMADAIDRYIKSLIDVPEQPTN